MREYQEKYIENTRRIVELTAYYGKEGQDFGEWVSERRQAESEIKALRQENIRLLSGELFPALDVLHSASEQTIEELREFASVLMDWKTNLDSGMYVVIHSALLSFYRVKKDRDNIIKELYLLGMGFYYMRRFAAGVEAEENDRLAFRNELVFTEASSYLRYFEDIEDGETRGYIIRSLHNITLCVKELKRRIQANALALQVMRDERIRQLAPDLPWDRFVRASHQQMSINRNGLRDDDLTKEELALVLDSCYEVFRPEETAGEKNIRWLWPYYEMEYCCGYADLNVTLDRMEQLIDSAPYDAYDMSGLYGNVQLPLYYGRYLQREPKLQTDEDRVRFLDRAYRKMIRTLTTCPPENFDDYFFYNVDIAVSNFYEMEGSLTYRELTDAVMKRFSGSLYIRARKAGEMMALISRAILSSEPGFFDDIPFIAGIADPAEKTERACEFARTCGSYLDFGIIKMNIRRTMETRELFADEDEIYRLHTLSGYEDLKSRRSTEIYADTALGHHSWYNGAEGYPESYVRNESPYRQMTDIAAVVTALLSSDASDADALFDSVLNAPRGRFSPVVVSYLEDSLLRCELYVIRNGDGEEYYREIYRELIIRSTDDEASEHV